MFDDFFAAEPRWPGEEVPRARPAWHARPAGARYVRNRASTPVNPVEDDPDPEAQPRTRIPVTALPDGTPDPRELREAADEQLQEDEQPGKQRLADAIRELAEAQQRVERDAERAEQRMRGELVAKLLPVLDNLDRSIEAADRSSESAMVEGLKLVRTQFEQVLAGYGLERIAAAGEPFDPELHEAVGIREVAGAADDGRVLRELSAGYRLGKAVLRAAKVQVGKRVDAA